MSQSQSEPNDVSEPMAREGAVDLTDAISAPEATSFTGRHPFVVYTALRFGLLVLAAVICYLLGARGLLLVLLAFLISGIVSFIVLAPQRGAVGQRTGSYFRRLNERIEASKSAEDDLVDEQAQAPSDLPTDGRSDQRA